MRRIKSKMELIKLKIRNWEDKKKEKENPPFLYDLTSLQREMNKQKSLSADNTLKILQNLYEKKLITYPRTDSRHLSSDMKPVVANTLHKLSQIAGEKLSRLNLQRLPFSKRIINNALTILCYVKLL